MAQLFFTSYAHQNRDKVLEKFVERLRDEVLQRGARKVLQRDRQDPIKPEDVVFFDSEGIQTGEEWVKKLSAAVTQCKVCVAICSPDYVDSEFCGKEIRVFLERLREWEGRAENAGAPGRPIVPVIWVKDMLPGVLARFQYDEIKFPREYREQGLRTLCQLNKYRDQRTRVVITLAERIVDAAKADLPPRSPIPHFGLFSSVFHEQPRGARYGVALVALVQGGPDARLYGQDLTLRRLVDEACVPRISWRALEQDGQLKDRLGEARENREIMLVVADWETLRDPLYQGAIAAVDASAGEQTAFLIVGPEAPATSAAQEKDALVSLRGHFPNVLPKVWHCDGNSICSVESLRKSLGTTIPTLRSRLVNEDPARAARDPQIAAAAAAEGVPIDRLSVVNGPGGKGT